MGETVASSDACEESVSFGKFENDSSLSWEKWSSFSPNKHKEEVEKCAAFGSVAQKRAYFESHYKKIAFQKPELRSSQENQIENRLSSSHKGNSNDMIGYSHEVRPDTDAPNDLKQHEKVESDNTLLEDVHDLSLKEQFDDDQSVADNQTSQVKGVKGKLDMTLQLDDVKTNKSKEDALPDEGQEENLPQTLDVKVSLDVKGLQLSDENERGIFPKSQKRIVDTNLHKKPQKINPVYKERDVAKTKKKPEVAATLLPTLTSRKSKPSLGLTAAAVVKSSMKHASTSPLQRNNNPSAGENKKVHPKSLHMSLNLGPKGSDTASPIPTRQSLIMENMAQKDIVKRAFKAFQNEVAFMPSRSFQHNQSSETKGMTSVVADRTSTSMTDSKEHGRSCRTGVEQTGSKASPFSSTLRSDERAENRKEFRNMVKETSNAKDAGKAHLRSKAEEKRAEEFKKKRQNSNFRAKPLPAFYRDQNKSNPHSRKVQGIKSVDGQLSIRDQLNLS